jgi:predicted GIY-YIG superfamily endonuclease
MKGYSMPHVYYIKNTIDSKMYVGFTSREDYKERIIEHFAPGAKGQTPLYRAIRKYGKESFEHGLLFTHDDYDITLQKEIELIELFGDYNISAGGNVPPNQKGRHWNHTEETKQKMRKPKPPRRPEHTKKLADAIRGRPSPFKGIPSGLSPSWKGTRSSPNMADWQITMIDGTIIKTTNLILWCDNNGYKTNTLKGAYYGNRLPYRDISAIRKCK